MFKMSSAGCNAGCQSLAPFTDHLVNHFLVQMVPFLLDIWRSSSTSVILWCLYTTHALVGSSTLHSQRGSDPDCLAAIERVE